VIAVGERVTSSITTTLYKDDKNGMIFWKVIDSPLGPMQNLYSVAAGQVMAELRGNSNPQMTSRNSEISRPIQANTAPVSNTPPQFVTSRTSETPLMTLSAISSFQSPKEWQRLKTALDAERRIKNIREFSLLPE